MGGLCLLSTRGIHLNAMRDNQLKPIFYLLVLAVAFLFGTSLLPDFSIGGYRFKKPALWSDIQPDTIKAIALDTQTFQAKVSEKKIAVHRNGSLVIEDFGQNNLKFLSEKIPYTKVKPIRVAFFGDSFIEGDILCGPFRDTLQQIFGGSGVGYMPITSEVKIFRTTIHHDFANWNTFSLVGKRSVTAPLGFPGFCFVPGDQNEVVYSPTKKNFVTAKFFYESDFPFTMKSTLNDTTTVQLDYLSTKEVAEFVFPQRNFSSVKMSFPQHEGLRLYGTAFEDSVGISVDNFGIRSNPGMGLLLIDQDRLRQFNTLRNYQLIILQFGLNVLSEKDTTGYVWYLNNMTILINRLKEYFPKCGFLLISVGDRSSNQQGKFATMPDILVMRDIQRKIAQRTRIAFWDMFEAMGGENSMVRYTESHPPLAAKDYTHLTFRGGRKIAKKLADAILLEMKNYESNK